MKYSWLYHHFMSRFCAEKFRRFVRCNVPKYNNFMPICNGYILIYILKYQLLSSWWKIMAPNAYTFASLLVGENELVFLTPCAVLVFVQEVEKLMKKIITIFRTCLWRIVRTNSARKFLFKILENDIRPNDQAFPPLIDRQSKAEVSSL